MPTASMWVSWQEMLRAAAEHEPPTFQIISDAIRAQRVVLHRLELELAIERTMRQEKEKLKVLMTMR